MPEPTCACPKPYWSWTLAPCNEDGWCCSSCGEKAPGEPAGYRPDLDRSHVEDKVMAILMDLHEVEIIYVSNGSDGDSVVGMVARECARVGYFDQYSIVQFIMRSMNRTHADYWKQIGDGVVAGADVRDRCACGKLAKCWRNGEHFCADCRGPMLASIAAGPETEDAIDPWQAFGDWETRWRDEHPDDERSSLELIDEYAKEGQDNA